MDSSQVKSQLELSRNVNDIQSMEHLRRAAREGDDKALHEAAQQFEAVFVQMMLKSMRKAEDVLADENSPFNSDQVKFYRDMHDQQMANDLSSSGSIGLADIIVQQLSHSKEGYLPSSAVRSDGDLSSRYQHALSGVDTAQAAQVKESPAFKKSAFESPEAFVQEIMPHIESVAAKAGLDPKALLAQAAVETGWGQFMIHAGNGQNSHNLFGIKADQRWQGDKAVVNSLEYQDGVAAQKKSPFRAYDSFADSVEDYVSFIQQNGRYQEALDKGSDGAAYVQSLQDAGYATDPNYANKIKSVMNTDTVSHYLPE